ncbi:MAG: thioredoxin-disulfide reductase [Desulfuromonas sp.]|nr:MAG: thioredoxin-disulfide reductase [Desulfuromonas sp.]
MATTTDAIYETIILGSGPAGLTAAIYAARSRCCPLVIQGMQAGGQLTTTTDVENFPGFSEGIDGPTLMSEMEKQASRFGTQFITGEVTRVELQERPFRIWIGDDLYRCLTLIISTGASPRLLGLPNEEKLYGRGVSVCATCDGFFYRDKDIVMVGGGDSAVEEAVFLTRFARKVTMVHRRDTLRATPVLADRALSNKAIEFKWNSEVAEILEDEQGVTGIRLKHVEDGREEELPCDGVFIAIGHIPNTSLFKGQLEMTDDGYLKTRSGTETNIPGVFAAGDVMDPFFRQAITAAGAGCKAAIQAERFLDNLPIEDEGLICSRGICHPK